MKVTKAPVLKLFTEVLDTDLKRKVASYSINKVKVTNSQMMNDRVIEYNKLKRPNILFSFFTLFLETNKVGIILK